MIIERSQYLDKLIKKKENGFIKVIKGRHYPLAR